ncbi:MAG: amino acid ABC transporter substrate-binding protein, partial [Gammaproteobacteria bacterium]|nr:amino acid ABC transporter substrate-binding protein [Gammaproteobacteria bacterium]
PLGPMVRRGDDEWLAIARWVLNGLIEAEEYGITQTNIEQMKTSDHPQIGRLLGVTEDLGKLLGLDKEWLLRAIKASGNYGEIFERNVGTKTSINLPRGTNNLWNNGGLMYASPLR